MGATVKAKKFPAIADILSTGERISLSSPSKMPCYSWSIPAGETCPGAKLSIVMHGDNAVCTECYAEKGFYRMPSTQNAQLTRRAWLGRSLAHDGGEEFVTVMSGLIRRSVRACGKPLFRGHDAGDFYSVPYINAWVRIVSALPDVRFWFPTRSYIVPNLVDALKRFAALPNVSLRPSGLDFDSEAPMLEGFAAGTTVARSLPIAQTLKGNVCPATTDIPQCEAHGCTNCWDKVVPTIYIEH